MGRLTWTSSPARGLNNEAISFNGRTPSFHLMALIITAKYAATAAVCTVFTLGAFIISKLCARSRVSRPATRNVQEWKTLRCTRPFRLKRGMTRVEIRAEWQIRHVQGSFKVQPGPPESRVCSSFAAISDDKVNLKDPILVKSPIESFSFLLYVWTQSFNRWLELSPEEFNLTKQAGKAILGPLLIF